MSRSVKKSHPKKPQVPPVRVRIHLNLACPARAESSIKVKSATGAWITVAYAEELVLENVVPVVHVAAQQAIIDGRGKKTPHAFLEGDLVGFHGRMREKLPESVRRQAAAVIERWSAKTAARKEDFNSRAAINYNPRFASCFYQDAADKSAIDRKFVSAARLVVCGWKFFVRGAVYTPLKEGERVQNFAASLAKTSDFERQSIARGKKATARRLEKTVK